MVVRDGKLVEDRHCTTCRHVLASLENENKLSVHGISKDPVCKEKYLFLSWQLYFIDSDSKCSFVFGLAVVIGIFILFLRFFRKNKKFCSHFCLLGPNLKKLEDPWALAQPLAAAA